MAVSADATGTVADKTGSTFTVTIASPGVFSLTGHGLNIGDRVTFATSGALPTGLTAGTSYFVIAAGFTANAFEVSTTEGGSAVNTSGSQSGTHTLASAEHILDDVAAAGVFTLHVDTINMASGDALELRIYQIVLTGGTRRVAYMATFLDAQPADDLIKISVPIANELTNAGSLRFTLRQRAGTGRSYPWKVLKY